jgi:sterol desaturase/sphingolipid hydroxylase (fatty acid hydroxylase superfamily)
LQSLIAFALAEFFLTNLLHKPRQRRKDVIVEIVGSSTLLLLTQPLVLLAGGLLAAKLAPQAKDSLALIPLCAQIGLFLVFDDMAQYWWHRVTHIGQVAL